MSQSNKTDLRDVAEPTYRVTVTVQPGHKVEICNPVLEDGALVDVIIYPSGTQSPKRGSLLDYIKTLPVGPRSAGSWEEIERELQKERDGWD
jgi:hypothetical protein